MKKAKLLAILLFFVFIVVEAYGTTLDSYDFCTTVEITDLNNHSKPVNCIGSSKEFMKTDEAMYIVANLSSLIKDDEITYSITNPSGEQILSEAFTVEQDVSEWYTYKRLLIAEQNLPVGEYTVKLFINDEQKVDDKFSIVEDIPIQCETEGYYCCPTSKVCLSAIEGGECGTDETCCEKEESCKTYSPNDFSRREVTDCEAEISDCSRVIRLYEYDIHAPINPPQTAVMYYKDVDIDCADKLDVAIAYYDEETGTWDAKVTDIVPATGVKGVYKATALLDHLGYIALIRTDECVPTLCTYGGYRTDPIGAYVNFGEEITFEICSMISGCEAIKDGYCDKECAYGIDVDCPECTAQQGDCCLISYDGKCDLDCAPKVDPDCCEKSKGLCCSGSEELSGSKGCDKNCGTADTACQGCTSGGDCCNGKTDGVCDPDCPKLSNGVGYVDADCCVPNGVAITSAKGDCCRAVCDGVCDPDCIVGLDPDCLGRGCCGDGYCDPNTESCEGWACLFNGRCEADCGVYEQPYYDGGGGSTPFIAVYDGEGYKIDNDFMFGNPTSYYPNYERGKNFYETNTIKNGDNYVLQYKPEVINGKIKLRILEHEYEESFIDKLELYSVHKDMGTNIFVKNDYTKIYALKSENLVYPDYCRTSEGKDCLQDLNNKEKDLVLENGQYADIKIGGQQIRITWTDVHNLDSVALLKDGTEYPFEMKKLNLLKAYSHRLKKDLKDSLEQKDFDYLHTIRGDVIDLEFEGEKADEYLLLSDGFYTDLRVYLYPEVDFDYVEKFWNIDTPLSVGSQTITFNTLYNGAYGRSLNLLYLEDGTWKQFGHLQPRDINPYTEVVEPPEGVFKGISPKLLITSSYSGFEPSIISKN